MRGSGRCAAVCTSFSMPASCAGWHSTVASAWRRNARSRLPCPGGAVCATRSSTTRSSRTSGTHSGRPLSSIKVLPPWMRQACSCHCSNLGIHVKRDNRRSIAYSEELIFPIAATLQNTDRRHGIVGQEYCHFQRDSCIRPTEPPESGGSHRAFQKQRTSPPPGNGSPGPLPGVVVVGNASRPRLADPPGGGHAVCVRLQTRG